MDLVNIGRSRRFLRERPIRVNLFDRPRLVCDLICLEAEQTEKRRGLTTSDTLYLVIEGLARIQTGPQIEEMVEQDAALIPPGVDHTIENIGPGRLTVMVLVTPKPSRAGEVRMPVEGQPRRRSYSDDDGEGSSREPRRDREDGPPRDRDRPERPRRGFDGPPPRDRRPPRPTVNREVRGERETEGPAWFPRPKPAWRPRGAPPAGAGRRGPGRPSGPPRGRGGPPSGPRGRSERPEGERNESSAGPRGRTDRAAGSGPRPPSGGRARTGPPRGGPPRGGRGSSPSRPDRQGGSRGRPPPRRNARPAPGRNGPKTSTRRQSPES